MSFSEWKKVKLEDIVDALGDGLHGTPKYDEAGEYHFINGNNLNGKIVIDDKTKRVSKDEYEKYKKPLNERTVFVSINGTLGNVAEYNDEKIMLGKSACYFNIKSIYSKDFVKYIMRSQLFKNYLSTHSSGTTIKNMGLKQMRAFEFVIPPIDEQKSIAHILSTLDEKIEVNNQINKTLENMAQAIFKQWFVDFEFPNEDGEPYLTSGGEMVESELGMIPKGWEVNSIRDLTEVVSKGTTPKKSDIDKATDGNSIKFLKVKDISNDGTIEYTNLEDIPKSVHENQLKRSILFSKDILISIAGTIGRVSYVDEKLINANTNQAVAFVRLNDIEKYFNLIIYKFKSSQFQESIASKVVQGVQANISLTVIKNEKLVEPTTAILELFNNTVSPIFKKIEILNNQNCSLKDVRDILLTKLMSGEIRVPLDSEGEAS